MPFVVNQGLFGTVGNILKNFWLVLLPSEIMQNVSPFALRTRSIVPCTCTAEFLYESYRNSAVMSFTGTIEGGSTELTFQHDAKHSVSQFWTIFRSSQTATTVVIQKASFNVDFFNQDGAFFCRCGSYWNTPLMNL